MYPGQYTPKCSADGTFREMQCDGRECWCAKPDGEKVYGTRQQFNYDADKDKMECTEDEEGNLK